METSQSAYGVYEAYFMAKKGKYVYWAYVDNDYEVIENTVSVDYKLENIFNKIKNKVSPPYVTKPSAIPITNTLCEFVTIATDEYGRISFLDLQNKALLRLDFPDLPINNDIKMLWGEDIMYDVYSFFRDVKNTSKN